MHVRLTSKHLAGLGTAFTFSLLCLAQPAAMAWAQDDTGRQGRVYERLPDGGIGPSIAGAALQFIGEDGSLAGRAVSDANGAYRVALPAGRYRTTAKAQGYETYSSGDGFAVVREGGGFGTLNFFLTATEAPAAPLGNSDGTVGGSAQAGTGSDAFRLNFSAQGDPLDGRIRYAPESGPAVRGNVNVCFRRAGNRVALGGELIGDAAPAPFFEVVLEDHGSPGDHAADDRVEFRTASSRPRCDLGEAPAHAVARGNVDLQPRD